MRNKLITLLFASTVFLSSGTLAIDRKYKTGYDLVPASINTAAKENNISFYRNNQIIILKPDPKGKNNKPVAFTATIKENGDIGKPKISKELSNLGLSSTVAYDSVAGKLYFSKYNSIEKDYALYESTVSKGKWGEAKQMRIEGTGGQRGKNSFMLSAGWSYKTTGLTGFKNPSIAKNGKRIYFTSNIRGKEYGNIGSTDIWFIDQKEDGTWGKPQNPGKNINTTSKEDYAFCVGDTTLYFSSIGKGGMDIFESTLKNGQWTKGVNLGKPICSGMNDFNLITNDKNVFVVSNRNPKGKDDIYLFRKQPDKPIIPEPVVIPAEPEPDPVVVLKKNWNFVLFYFDFDKDVLSEEFTKQFKELVEEMKQFPGETFEIAGHTDQKGSNKYNQKLSEHRASFVKQMLIKEGFPASKLVAKGFGESMPVVEDPKSEDDFAQNRRCEIRIIGQNDSTSQKVVVQPASIVPVDDKKTEITPVVSTESKKSSETKPANTNAGKTPVVAPVAPTENKTTVKKTQAPVTTPAVETKPTSSVKTSGNNKTAIVPVENKTSTTKTSTTTKSTGVATTSAKVETKPTTDTKSASDKKTGVAVDKTKTNNSQGSTKVGTTTTK